MSDEPLDSSDLDALEELKRSRGWALVVKRISEQLELNRQELETPLRPPDVLRGQIKSLRLALTLPQILQDEISNILKETE